MGGGSGGGKRGGVKEEACFICSVDLFFPFVSFVLFLRQSKP